MNPRPARSQTRPKLARRPRRIAPEPPRQNPLEARMRASSATQDRALYGCACGCQFTAAVATSVACPHCGAGQAW